MVNYTMVATGHPQEPAEEHDLQHNPQKGQAEQHSLPLNPQQVPVEEHGLPHNPQPVLQAEQAFQLNLQPVLQDHQDQHVQPRNLQPVHPAGHVRPHNLLHGNQIITLLNNPGRVPVLPPAQVEAAVMAATPGKAVVIAEHQEAVAGTVALHAEEAAPEAESEEDKVKVSFISK